MAEVRVIKLNESVYSKNDNQADMTRRMLNDKKVFFVNIMSSPGSGKTTMLSRLINMLKDDYRIGEMDVDIESDIDARRVAESTGVKTMQIHNGGLCHIDAKMTADAISEYGVDKSTDISYIVKKQAVDYIKQNYIETVITAIEDAGKDAQGNVEDIAAELNGVLSKVRIHITEEINKAGSKVSEYKTQMIEEVKNSMSEGADKLKETLNSKIDGIFGNSNAGVNLSKDNDNTGVTSLLSFAYSDYLRLFLIIGLYTNQEGVILRTADVIQVNMAKQPNRSGFKMSKASMYVELSATIQVKPTLLALPLFADVQGNPKDNTNWYTIQYKNIKGY